MPERPEYLNEDIAIYERDGDLWGVDDNGEFRIDPPYGNSEPQNGRCNAVLKATMRRYGEIRYCGMLPVGAFEETQYEHDDWCKNHQPREILMQNVIDLTKHGYFAQNYAIFEQSLDASEFAFSVDVFRGLLEQSKYDFDVETEVFEIDASDDDLISADDIYVEVPLPKQTQYKSQAQELWYFALDQVVEQRMQNIRLTEGVSGEQLAAYADVDGSIGDTITEASEHHLNLPISRITKDKKERLKIGGVEIGAEEGDSVMAFTTGDYVFDVGEEFEDEAVNEQTVSEQLSTDE